MMKTNKFIAYYRELCEISEFEADIAASEKYGTMLEAAGCGSDVKNLSAAGKMQLEASISEQQAEAAFALADTNGEQEIIESLIQNALNSRIEFYDELQKRALLIGMMQICDDLLDTSADDRENLLWTLDSTEVLKNRLSRNIQELAGQELATHLDVIGASDPDTVFEKAFSAKVGGYAAYLTDESLRTFPECIGNVAGVVEAARKETIRERISGTAEGVSLLLLTASSLMIVSILFGSVLASGSVMLLATETLSFTDTFVSCLQLLSVEWKLSTGIALSGLLAKSVAWLAASQDTAVSKAVEEEESEDTDELEIQDSDYSFLT